MTEESGAPSSGPSKRNVLNLDLLIGPKATAQTSIGTVYLTDQVAMVNQVADIAREDANTMAQVANNPRDVAMNGNIKGTVQAAVVRAMLSHQVQAEHLLKQDQQALVPFTALIYEVLKAGKKIDLSEFGE